MTMYQLTHLESWVLATLLHIPVQPNSTLIEWFLSDPSYQETLDIELGLTKLSEKGYYREQELPQFDENLVKALTLLAVNLTVFTVILRGNGEAALVRFAQAGEKAVQYGMNENHLSFHEIRPVDTLATTILPAWFVAQKWEGFNETFSLEYFLLFKQACDLEDWAWVRSSFLDRRFAAQELLAIFEQTTTWVELFQEIGLQGIPNPKQIAGYSILNGLIEQGYLIDDGDGMLQLSEKGRPLAATLTAVDTCSISCSLRLVENDEEAVISFLHGDERLFLLEYEEGKFKIQQLENLEAAHQRLESLLEQGKRISSRDFLIPWVTEDGRFSKISLKEEKVAVAQPAPKQIKYCVSCGEALPNGKAVRFCPFCGAKQPE